MDNVTKASVANLLRYSAKIIEELGWSSNGSYGSNGEVCATAAVVEAALRSEFDVHGSLVYKTVGVLDEAAKKFPKEQLSGNNDLSFVAQYNDAEGRTKKDIINFIGHTANQLTKWKV